MMKRLFTAAVPAVLSCAVLSFVAPSASAHATLETQQAVAGSYYKAVVRVGHGCPGGQASLKIRVKVPEGVTSVKPMPKAGWEMSIVKAALKTPISDGHGGQITEGVSEVIWTGKLEDAHYDEFVLRGKLPDQPGMMWWPIVQECANGAHRWIEIPAEGQSADSLKEPAAGLKIVPKP
jgi:uncharacterized protein YcnI